MTRAVLLRVLLGVLVLSAMAWFGVTRYTQPRALGHAAAPVRTFLADALSADSVKLSQRADSQPVQWVLAAVRSDSAAVREWAGDRGPVLLTHSGDTSRVTLRRSRSTPRCSVTSFLTAALVGPRGEERLVHLASSCPAVEGESSVGGN